MEQFNDEKYRRQSNEYLEDYMGIGELGKLFHSMIKLWENYDNRRQIIEYIRKNKDELYRLKIGLEQSKQISHDFYKNIGLEKCYNEILEESTGIEVNIGTTKEGKNIWSSGIQEEDGEYILNVRNHNSIETIFVISHEFMHAMTMYEEYNETKYLLREVSPYIIELILCDFLIENKDKYKFKEDELLHDLNLIKLTRFLNYYDKTNRCLRNDYIIALIICTQLESISKTNKLNTLLKLLDSLEKNSIIETLESLQLELDRKKENKRKKYIEEMFINFTNLFEKIMIKEKSKTKWFYFFLYSFKTGWICLLDNASSIVGISISKWEIKELGFFS